MLFAAISTLLCIVFIFSEIVPLYQNRDKRSLVIYIVTLGVAYVFSLLIAFNVSIPSPTTGIENIIKKII